MSFVGRGRVEPTSVQESRDPHNEVPVHAQILVVHVLTSLELKLPVILGFVMCTNGDLRANPANA